MKLKPNILLTITIIIGLALTSCGANNNSVIATAVAMTVQAQSSPTSQETTDTPLAPATDLPLSDTPGTGTPAVLPTLTPFAAQPTSSSGAKFCTANATFMGETVPDGTIESPGASFLKTWTIQNSGTCPWDSTWKFVYVSGDLMGASITYPLTATPPNQNMNFSIALTAPTTEGSYRGYWKLESPWGLTFGDSGSGNPFWVDINVNSGTPGKGTPTVYGVTSVTYSITQTGTCNSANLFFNISAYVSANGPVTITYYWHHSDGYNSKKKTLTFTDAGMSIVTDVWSQRVGSVATTLWDQFIETDPVQQSFGKATFQNNCH